MELGFCPDLQWGKILLSLQRVCFLVTEQSISSCSCFLELKALCSKAQQEEIISTKLCILGKIHPLLPRLHKDYTVKIHTGWMFFAWMWKEVCMIAPVLSVAQKQDLGLI